MSFDHFPKTSSKICSLLSKLQQRLEGGPAFAGLVQRNRSAIRDNQQQTSPERVENSEDAYSSLQGWLDMTGSTTL
jgi:hypothetical protein